MRDQQDRIIDLILERRDEQDEKWGHQDHAASKWSVILGEEYGEFCKAVLECGTA